MPASHGTCDSDSNFVTYRDTRTFDAGVSNLQEHSETLDAGSRLVKVRIWNPKLALLLTRTLRIQQTKDISMAAQIAGIFSQIWVFSLNTSTDLSTPVNCLLYQNDFILPTFRPKRFIVAEFLQLVQIWNVSVIARILSYSLIKSINFSFDILLAILSF